MAVNNPKTEEVFETIPPQAEVLKPYIKLYYIHTAEATDFHQKIQYYPNFTTTLNLYFHSQVSTTPTKRIHQYTGDESCLSIFVGRFNLSREIEHIGPLHKVSIVFNPLGMNQFVCPPLGTFVEEHFSYFTHWGDPFNNLTQQLYTTRSLHEIRDLLDAFFVEQFQNHQMPVLQSAIQQLFLTKGNIRIAELAQQIGISRRTLLRLFQKHLGTTVKDYASIIKFRKTLEYYYQQERKVRLTDLTYDANYYDQADFIHQFKFRTGQRPSDCLKQLRQIKPGLFWQVQSR